MIRFGVDHVAADPSLLGSARRVALATNDAARSAAQPDMHSRMLLHAAGVPLVRLFSPEHGIGAAAADGAAVDDSTDALTGLPILSLYGARFAPPRAALADLDVVLFDIPDVGARFYTYTWTLTHLIDACADARVPLCVLDRPNPLAGALHSVEGPLLEAAHFSFVGRHTLPIRHSLTSGEIALLWRAERRPDADIRMIECDGWSRDMLWPQTQLPFVPTSPALQTFEAALLYPGLCVFEATNVSVARGTTLSFEAIGAPWLRVADINERFSARALPGVAVTAVRFTPTVGPHAHVLCEGVRLYARDAAAVRPVATALALLADIATLHVDNFEWATYPTAANPSGAGHLERILGSTAACRLLREAPESIDAQALAALTAAPGWAERWSHARIYD